MAKKLHGCINLSKVGQFKSLITTNSKGEKVLWCDILEKRDGADQYGNTHTMTIYDKETRTTIYLGDFKPQEFGAAAPAAPAAGDDDPNNDLPFS